MCELMFVMCEQQKYRKSCHFYINEEVFDILVTHVLSFDKDILIIVTDLYYALHIEQKHVSCWQR